MTQEKRFVKQKNILNRPSADFEVRKECRLRRKKEWCLRICAVTIHQQKEDLLSELDKKICLKTDLAVSECMTKW